MANAVTCASFSSQSWATEMRQKFSPPEMLNEDGSINQDFFKPTQVVIVDSKKWGHEEAELLYKGLEEYGIGAWKTISQELLPQWSEQSLQAKAAKLMGTKSLTQYVGWKGNREVIDKEYEKNTANTASALEEIA